MLELHEGDFVLLPQTPGFTLASDLTREPALVTGLHTGELRHGAQTGPVTMRMLGGWFRFDRTNAPLLVKLLPPVIHIRRDEPGASRLRSVVELIAGEADADHPARELILKRLVEVLLVEALRFRPSASTTEQRGLLAGLLDPAIARALHAIHVDVAREWTVAELAERIGYRSASAFSAAFTRLNGSAPSEFARTARS